MLLMEPYYSSCPLTPLGGPQKFFEAKLEFKSTVQPLRRKMGGSRDSNAPVWNEYFFYTFLHSNSRVSDLRELEKP